MSRGKFVPADLDFEHDDGDFGDDDIFGEQMPTLLDARDEFAQIEDNTAVGRIRRNVSFVFGTFWNGAQWAGRIMKPVVYYGLVPFILGLGAHTTKTSIFAIIWPLHDLGDVAALEAAEAAASAAAGQTAPQ